MLTRFHRHCCSVFRYDWRDQLHPDPVKVIKAGQVGRSIKEDEGYGAESSYSDDEDEDEDDDWEVQ